MPTKLGNGGHSQEAYDSNTGKYTDQGNISNQEEKVMSTLGLTPKFNGLKSKNNLGQELSQGQEEYFKDSKMRDENGNLMIMYHSSNAKFTVFDLGFANLKDGKLQGFWLTNNPGQKYSYGNYSIEAYVNITNPINREEITLSNEQIKLLAEAGGLPRVSLARVQNFMKMGVVDTDYDIIHYFAPSYNEKFKEYISKVREITGYDGYILEDYDQQATYAVAFYPNQIKLVNNLNPTNSNSISDEQTQTNDTKQQQLEIIQKHNPAPNDINTWIRNVNDIKTLGETLEDSDYADYEEYNPDWTKSMAQEAINSGYVTVYSSYPIEQGIFVSPSRMEAQSYAGNGRVYSKKVPVNSIAWIDPTQGQYADIEEETQAMKLLNMEDY